MIPNRLGLAARSFVIVAAAAAWVPSSAAAAALPVQTPSEPRNVTATVAGPTIIDLDWDRPRSTGGSAITRYEVAVIEEDGTQGGFFSTGSTSPGFRVRGLRTGRRYGFRVRAVNSIGDGPPSGIVYATPYATTAVVTATGLQVPLLDLDRQSLIVRLGSQDCRLRVWWQPSSESWYSSLGL